MSHLRAAAPANSEGDRGRVSMAKVPRYWAGKRVEGADLIAAEEPGPASGKLFSSAEASNDVAKRTPVAAAVIVKKADPRLARLAKADVAEARGEGRQRHRCSCPAAFLLGCTLHDIHSCSMLRAAATISLLANRHCVPPCGSIDRHAV